MGQTAITAFGCGAFGPGFVIHSSHGYIRPSRGRLRFSRSAVEHLNERAPHRRRKIIYTIYTNGTYGLSPSDIEDINEKVVIRVKTGIQKTVKQWSARVATGGIINRAA